MQIYHLNDADIHHVCKTTEQFLDANKTEHMKSLRLRMMLEEILLNYQMRFGEEKEFSLETRKMFGRVRVVVSLTGESFDPFITEDDEDQALLSRMTADSHRECVWSYKDGVNVITILPEKKHRISSAAASVLAVVLAVVAGLAWMQLPDAIRTPFLEDYVSPVLNTVMGMIIAVAGPLIFFSLVWGITAIGDVQTLSKIGRKMMRGFAVQALCLTCLATAVCFPFFTISSEVKTPTRLSDILGLLLAIVPNNMVAPFVESKSQQIIFLAIVIGIVLLLLGEQVAVVSTFFDQMRIMIRYIMGLVTELIPFMVFLSIFKIIAAGQVMVFIEVYKLIPLFLGITLLFIAIYTLSLAIRYRVNVVTLIKKALPGVLICLSTGTAPAATSANIKACEESFGIDKKIVNIGVPVGQTLFRPAGALRYVLMGFVMAELYDVSITAGWVIILILSAFLLSLATPPVSGGAAVCFAILFGQLGIPEDAIGLAVAINVIIGFLESASNVFCLQMNLIGLADSLNMLDLKVLRQSIGGRSSE